jgi:hypothetical protein
MSRLVLFFAYTDPVKTGPASLGFSGDDARGMPPEADVTIVIELTDKLPCELDRSSVISATFNYGELSLGLDDLESFELGFTAQGEIDRLNHVFSPANTLSSTGITVTSNPSQSLIKGTDRTTGENFVYFYTSSKLTASRVPEQSTHAV